MFGTYALQGVDPLQPMTDANASPKLRPGLCRTPPGPDGVRQSPGRKGILIFDASTGLKTHLVAASFSFPQHLLWRKMRHSR